MDPVPRVGEQITTTSLGISPPMAGPELINLMQKMMPIHGDACPGQREQVSLTPETVKPQVASPSSEIIGEGAAIFTDMTDMILGILDKQVATSLAPNNIPRDCPLMITKKKWSRVKNQELLLKRKIILIYSYLLWKITG